MYITVSVITLLLSLLVFAYHKEYIILNFGKTMNAQTTALHNKKQKFYLYYWANNAWHSEQTELLFGENTAANLQQIVGRWAAMLYEEKIIKKKLTVQSATISFDSRELIVSFDRPPFNKEISTYEKWMIIEGLLKTIQSLDACPKRVLVLVNQQPLNDPHIDFTNSWPVEGFRAS